MRTTRTTHSGQPAPGSRRTRGRRGRIATTALAASLVALGTVALAGAIPASASTLNGIATIASPGTATALTSGGSTTPFTVALPSQAACDADTASHGYHVYSYLVPKATAPSGVTFVNFPSTGYGFVDNTGLYYGAVNTAIGTGQIVGIPNTFQWAPLVTKDSVPLTTLLFTGTGTKASGIWEAGIACATSSGTVADNWNEQVTFTANSSDAHGFTWTAVPAVQVVTKTLSPSTATIGTAYAGTALVASGGVAPYKWKVTSGALPKGLKLSATTGVIAGTVKAGKTAPAPGPYSFTVTVTDHSKGAKLTATANFTLTLAP